MIKESYFGWFPKINIKDNGFNWPYQFKKFKIYHIKAREIINKEVPEGGLLSYYNCFLITDLIKESKNDELTKFLHDYRNPVEIIDEHFGKFKLNKDNNEFEGEINWIGKKIIVSLEVDKKNSQECKKSMNYLYTLSDNQKKWDDKFRKYAGKEHIDSVNDNLDYEDEISLTDFLNRISLSHLIVNSNQGLIAIYDDDGLIGGHSIVIYGNIETGDLTLD